jgi:hypothetical protein
MLRKNKRPAQSEGGFTGTRVCEKEFRREGDGPSRKKIHLIGFRHFEKEYAQEQAGSG